MRFLSFFLFFYIWCLKIKLCVKIYVMHNYFIQNAFGESSEIKVMNLEKSEIRKIKMDVDL